MPAVSAALLRDFAAALGPHLEGVLRTDAMTRALYATDASIYQVQPVGVLIPKRMDDVQAAVEEAARFGIPVLARGGGSSLAGQTVGAALVIDFSCHLDAVLDLNVEERRVRVQPGLVLDDLTALLEPHGLMVGPDPASSNRATLGGMVGNNATGTHSILYGNVINHIRSVRAFLADGTAAVFDAVTAEGWRARARRSGPEGQIYGELGRLLEEQADVIACNTPKHWRRNSGYRLEYLLGEQRNIAQLLCGSEGTLAVTAELEIGLMPRPKRTALGIVHFRTRREALQAVTTILETEPSAVELFDGHAIEQTRRAPGYAHQLTFIEGRPGAVLITEYYGEAEAELAARLDRLEQTLRRAGEGYAVVRALAPQQIKNVWTVRKEGLGLIMGVKGDHKPQPFIEDASVPVEHLADYIDELDDLLERTATPVVMYAHASAGTLHVRPFINIKDAREVEKMRDIAWGSMELVAKYGGAVSSEHGDGLARSWLTPTLVGPELYEVYRQVKRIFDPAQRLNPGKVVDAPPMTENLRKGAAFGEVTVLEVLDFSEQGGFEQAVELCNGNGACRKLQGGTMCPSFMVTRQEEDSTRGRANALRAAMSGELPREALTSARMYEVMDLCVQCKACKTECPSNVDMAKIKTEWLGKYWETNRMPLRTRLFAHLPAMSRRMAGRMARSVNWLNSRKSTRAMLERTLGISAQRALPPFAAVPFTTWFRRQAWASTGAPVVLFADTFNNYHHPDVSQAAAEFLHRSGHRVVVPEEGACCGRTLLSKGVVDKAQLLALKTVELLHPYAEQDMPIIGLEPSCILTFRDEFLALLPGDPRAAKVAAVTLTFEEFVARQAEAGALEAVRWTEAPRRILLHGHCHQKALVGTGAAVRCLTLPPNYQVETVDAGCCGMAGAFGYEKEHYEISVAMAERRLAPAVRAAAPETIIAAAGTSCRAQIEDTTGRQALHPAQVLRAALDDGR